MKSEDPQNDPFQKAETSPERVQQKAEWLNKKISESIARTSRNKAKNRRRATIIKLAMIGFAGLATILLGLQITGYERYFKEIAFVLGAIVTLLNALEPFFNFRGLWVEHEAAQAGFYRLQDKLDFYLAGTDAAALDDGKLNALYDEYQEIWVSLNETWIQYRREGQVLST